MLNIKYEEDEAISLESKLDSLLSLSDKLIAESGMNKQYALEALDILPNFNNNIPLAYYTKDSSIAQFSVSLETIIESIWEMIKAACDYVIKMVKKFINWLFPKEDNLPSKEVEDLKIKAQDDIKMIDEYELLMKDLLNTTNELAKDSAEYKRTHEFANEGIALELNKPIKSINQLVDLYIANSDKSTELSKLLQNDDPLIDDVLSNKKYSKTIKSSSHVITILPQLVEKTTKGYFELAQSVDTRLRVLHGAKEDLKPIEVNLKPIELDIFGDGKQITIADGVAKIVEIRDVVKKEHIPNTTLSFSDLNETFIKSINETTIINTLKKIESTKDHIEKLDSNLNKASASIENLASFHPSADPLASRYGRVLRDAFKIARADVMSTIKFYYEIIQYVNILKSISRKISDAQNTVIRLIESEIKGVTNNGTVELKHMREKYSSQLG